MNKTNTHRANRGLKLLDHHQMVLLEEFDSDHNTCGFASLLADLRHAADKADVDFFEALDLSYQHYLEERQGCDDYLDAEEQPS